MAIQYTIGCYTKSSYVYCVPLRASTAWLKKTLRRKSVINAVPLRKSQFFLLTKRLPWGVEISWLANHKYYIETIWKTKDLKAIRSLAKTD